MESNEFRKVSIKNRTCCYFDGIINFEDLDSENTLVYISYKILIVAKPSSIRFDEIDGFIKV